MIWQTPTDNLELAADEVHVWRGTLNQSPEVVERLRGCLSPDEQEKAARFYHEHDRRHSIIARSMLRAILARYLDCAPSALRFSYSAFGKPELRLRPLDPPLRFNLSHSKDLALVAVTLDCAIGIDLEWVRKELLGEQIAERFFSAAEVSSLRALPHTSQVEAFFNCWTRKEAYIKARGLGLSLPLESFDVSLKPGEPAALLRTREHTEEAARWSLKELPVAPGYAAAVAVERAAWRLCCYQWQP